MNIRTEIFKADHMIEISDNIIEQTFTPEQWRGFASYNEQTSVGLTAYVGDKIMACAGLRITKPIPVAKRWKRKGRPDKVALKTVHSKDNTLWVVIHKRSVNHIRELFYSAKLFIEILTKDIEADSIKCQICTGFDEGHRFVKHLGFIPTGDQAVLGFDDYELKLERVAA